MQCVDTVFKDCRSLAADVDRRDVRLGSDVRHSNDAVKHRQPCLLKRHSAFRGVIERALRHPKVFVCSKESSLQEAKL